MDDTTKQIVKTAVDKILLEMQRPSNIAKFKAKHDNKVHFIPQQYRVLGGMLHSLNIKFGTFIEVLLAEAVKQEDTLTSVKIGKTITFDMPQDADRAIKNHIGRKKPVSEKEFKELLDKIVLSNQPDNRGETTETRKDVDVIFQTKEGTYVYVEVKYNDDHDTGKFPDINGKLLTTYAGLVQKYGVNRSENLKPILYYFNAKGPNIYLPSDNVYAGKELFDEFFPNFKYDDLKNYLQEIGDDKDIIKIFDDFYKTIRGA